MYLVSFHASVSLSFDSAQVGKPHTISDCTIDLQNYICICLCSYLFILKLYLQSKNT